VVLSCPKIKRISYFTISFRGLLQLSFPSHPGVGIATPTEGSHGSGGRERLGTAPELIINPTVEREVKK
jgi:hypothetical protein